MRTGAYYHLNHFESGDTRQELSDCRLDRTAPRLSPRQDRRMASQPSISDEIFSAFLKCRYKAYFKLTGQSGEVSPYANRPTA